MDESSSSSDPHHNLPLQKVTISGPTLSSLLHHLTASPGPTHGLLFGHFSLLAPTSLSDDSSSLSPPPSSSLVATVTSFSTNPTSTTAPHRHPLIGHFSVRRLSPLRPSLLDHSRSHSLSLSSAPSSLFLLLTTAAPSAGSTIHTHEYRAYRYDNRPAAFDAVSLEVVNVGPGFRGQYGNFTPKSELPWLAPSRAGSPMREDASLKEMKRAGDDQAKLSAYVADGYEVGRLGRLVGSDAVGYMGGVEELYDQMLAKLHGLARAVESSSSRVLELENHNMKLRRRVAGIE